MNMMIYMNVNYKQREVVNMKAESIEMIHNILKQRVERTREKYQCARRLLEIKYGVEWLGSVIPNKVIPDKEKIKIDDDRELMLKTIEVLKDFENHQWT